MYIWSYHNCKQENIDKNIDMNPKTQSLSQIKDSSKLNFRLYSLHVLDSPACPCGHDREDSNHYLLYCLLYFQVRITMLNKIRHLSRTHISCDLLLYGAPELDLVTNYKVFDVVHEFISSTDRL